MIVLTKQGKAGCLIGACEAVIQAVGEIEKRVVIFTLIQRLQIIYQTQRVKADQPVTAAIVV